MPAHTAVLAPLAAPGMELACRAHNLPAAHPAAPRGVISYYATRALAEARTLADWLARTEALAYEDARAGELPLFYQPRLCILPSEPDLAHIDAPGQP